MIPDKISEASSLQEKTFPSLVKQAAEALTVLAVSSYTVGFLIVNSYLLTWGYSGTSLFKVRYVSAGLLFLVISTLILASLYPMFWAKQEERKFNPSSLEIRRKAVFMGSGIALFFLYQVLNHITDTEVRLAGDEHPWLTWMPIAILGTLIALTIVEVSNWQWKWASWLRKNPDFTYPVFCLSLFFTSYEVVLVLCIAVLIFALWLSMKFLLQSTPVRIRFQDWPVSVLRELSMIIMALLTAIGLFATYMYGHIKPQFGGGLPARVKVVVAEEKKDQLKRLGLGQEPETWLGDVRLIDSSEIEYLLLVKLSYEDKGVLVRLDSNMVDLVLYIPSSQ